MSMSISPETIVEGIPTLASSSEVYARLSEKMSDPNASVTEFGEIIQTDPDLTARLLRLANSSFFGYTTGIKTVGDALLIIGVQQVKDLVISTTVINYFKGVSSDLVNMRSFWQHSLVCGIAARILAMHRRNLNPEQAFASGLMHDMGRLVLLLQEPEKVRDIFNLYEGSPKTLTELELECFGFHHGDVGGALLKSWGLPAPLVYAVRYHHQPTECELFPVDAALIHFGDLLAHSMEYGGSGERKVPSPNMRAWAKLELAPDILKPTMKEVDRQFEEVALMFLD